MEQCFIRQRNRRSLFSATTGISHTFNEQEGRQSFSKISTNKTLFSVTHQGSREKPDWSAKPAMGLLVRAAELDLGTVIPGLTNKTTVNGRAARMWQESSIKGGSC